MKNNNSNWPERLEEFMSDALGIHIISSLPDLHMHYFHTQLFKALNVIRNSFFFRLCKLCVHGGL